jgi:hypothetical protein
MPGPVTTSRARPHLPPWRPMSPHRTPVPTPTPPLAIPAAASLLTRVVLTKSTDLVVYLTAADLPPDKPITVHLRVSHRTTIRPQWSR